MKLSNTLLNYETIQMRKNFPDMIMYNLNKKHFTEELHYISNTSKRRNQTGRASSMCFGPDCYKTIDYLHKPVESDISKGISFQVKT